MVDRQALKQWFIREKRDLPWRQDPTPYKVWISEVMLQQTRACVVTGYFLRWMEKFPSLQDLAAAPYEVVLKQWEGLGYYSRVRHIHAAAQVFAEKGIPSSYQELCRVKGLGPYTAGAILSFAFHQKALAIDANVRRVISRYFALSSHKEISSKVALFLEGEAEPWIVMEALIELGAVYCAKVPLCRLCPLQGSCLARIEGKQEQIPAPKIASPILRQELIVGVILCQRSVLIQKALGRKVFRELSQLPSCFRGQSLEKDLDLSLVPLYDLPKEKQSFLRVQQQLFPTVYQLEERVEREGFFWCPYEEIEFLSFPSGHRRIIQTWKAGE